MNTEKSQTKIIVAPVAVQQPQKPKRNRRKKNKKNKARKRAMMRDGIGSGRLSLTRTACSLTNPFCAEAFGARWTDNSYTKSNPTSVIVPISLPVTAFENTIAFTLAGYAGIAQSNLTGSTSGAWTFDDTTVYATSPPTGLGRWRITSWGLRIQNIGSLTDTKGMCRVRLTSGATGASLVNQSASNLVDRSIDIPLSRLSNTNLYVIPASLGTNARLFRPAPTNLSVPPTLTNLSLDQWQNVTVAFTGIGTGFAAAVDLFYHAEYVFTDGQAAAAYATAPPKQDTAATELVGKLTEVVQNFVVKASEAAVDASYQRFANMLQGRYAMVYHRP